MRTLLVAMSAMLAFVMSSMSLSADSADPAIGTWKLNLEKSHFSAGHAPKSMSRTYAAVSGGTSMTVTGEAADGSAISESATLTYDGKDDAFTGSSMWDAVALKRVNGTTVKAELKKGGVVVGHTTRTVSDKGKVLTLTSSYKSAKGGTIHQTAVYDKQ